MMNLFMFLNIFHIQVKWIIKDIYNYNIVVIVVLCLVVITNIINITLREQKVILDHNCTQRHFEQLVHKVILKA